MVQAPVASRKTRKDSGLTLVELIIALAVIGIALLQAIEVIVSTNQLKATTREFTVAREIAASEIESLKARAQSNGLDDVNTYITANPNTATTRLTGGNINRTCDPTNPRLYNVTITVTWQGSAGKNPTFSTSAMIAR
jgi:prepilin-type N-terminal cleavage/methylation domain-containing protein